ncbi:hypothetical protein CANCADRAFT_2677 [Tortispora caseinolytica NRRL Y-17796]|uniref:MMS19 nucleotide excision repair protein n=1 Tax=Tortispora caseinolytica NRRL Y-17796 TaxID=767744 RepID=A0A1E4TH03_9ASCO|nr:hypothetical protein CANCADRAFT_2677 [Tortispora caseinolytica NRRL Y-17796]
MDIQTLISRKQYNDIAALIKSRALTIIDFITTLHPYLVDSDDDTRANANFCLSSVIALIADTLTIQQVSVLLQFFIDKLNDSATIESSLDAIAILSQSVLADSDLTAVLEALNIIDMQVLLQPVRYNVFKLANVLLDVQKLPNSFVETYISLATGEKDPRNLLVSFENVYLIISKLDISQSVEDLFDICYCYFPILFKASANSTNITPDQLKISLNKALSATPLFAPQLIPSLLEKLNSTATSVKDDALTLLTACISSYEPEVVDSYYKSIWNAVKFEVYHTPEDSTRLLSLKLLQTLATSLSLSESNSVTLYIEAVVNESVTKITDPSAKDLLPYSSLLSSVAQSTPYAFKKIADAVINEVINTCQRSSDIAKKKSLLAILSHLVESSYKAYGSAHTDGTFQPQKLSNPLIDYSQTLLDTYNDYIFSTSDPQFRILAIEGVVLLAQSSLLSRDQLSSSIQYIDEILLTNTDKALTDASLKALQSLSNIDDSLIIDISFPALLSALDSAEHNLREYGSVLYSLSCLSVRRSVFDVLVRRVLSRVDSSSDEEHLNTLLGALLYSLKIHQDTDYTYYVSRLAEPLIARLVRSWTRSSLSIMSSSSKIVQTIARIVELIIRNSTTQESFASELITLMFSENSSKFGEGENFHPLKSQADISKSENALILFCRSFAPLKQDIPITGIDIISLVKSLYEFELKSKDVHSYRLVTLTLLSNKYLQDAGTIENLASFDSPSDLEKLAWISKGLCMKMHGYGFQVFEECLNKIGDERLTPMQVIAIEVILADNEIVGKENGAQIMRLYRQRCLGIAVPIIIAKSKEGTDLEKTNSLIALGKIIKHVPAKAVSNEMGQLFTLLLQCLDIEQPDIQEAAEEAIIASLDLNGDIVEEHLNSVTNRMLKLSISGKSADVRRKALECITHIPLILKRSEVQIIAKKVLKEVVPALNDSRRTVRKAAVDCREAYYRFELAN